MPPFVGFTRRAQTFSKRKYRTDAVVRLVTGRANFGRALDLALGPTLEEVSFIGLMPDFGLMLSIGNRLVGLQKAEGELYTYQVFAGTANSGHSNDYRTKSLFKGVSGFCPDHHGNLLVCDQGNSLIRKIGADGMVETFVGDCSEENLPRTHRRNTACVSPSRIAALPGGEVFYCESTIESLVLILTDGNTVKLTEFENVRDVAVWDDSSVLVTTSKDVSRVSSTGQRLSTVVTAEQLNFEPSSSIHDSLGGCIVVESRGVNIAIISSEGVVSDLWDVWSGPSKISSATPEDGALPGVLKASNDFFSAIERPWIVAPSLSNPNSPGLFILDTAAASYGVWEVGPQKPPLRIVGQRFGSRFGSLIFAPTGHLLEFSNYGMRWMNEEGDFKLIAGSDTDIGFVDAELLNSRFTDITSATFVPLDTAHNLTVLRPPMRRPDPSNSGFLQNLIGSHSILLSDSSNHRIREIKLYSKSSSSQQDPSGSLEGRVATYAGSANKGHVDGPRETCCLEWPSIIKYHSFTGDIWILEGRPARLRVIRAGTGLISTLKMDLKPLFQDIPIHDRIFSSMETSGGDPGIYLSLNHSIIKVMPSFERASQSSDLLEFNTSAAIWAGKENMYHDGERMEACFASNIKLACHPSDGAFLVVDRDNSSIRIIRNDHVSTLAGQVKSGRSEGAPFQARFFRPTQIACSPQGYSLVSDAAGELTLIDHIHVKPLEAHGLRKLIPKADHPQPHSDIMLEIHGAKWYLHALVVRLRCPGLLEEDALSRIQAIPGLTPEIISALLFCAYTDCYWNPSLLLDRHSMIPTTTSEAILDRLDGLFKMHLLGKLARNDKFLTLIENDIFDCYRYCLLWKRAVIDILKAIAVLKNEAEVQLRLFLPFAILFYHQSQLREFSMSDVANALTPRQDLQVILVNHVKENKYVIPNPMVYDYHDSWKTSFRSLLVIGSMASNTQEMTEAARLNRCDTVIEGKDVRIHCHKLIISKAPFFERMFASAFKESKEATCRLSQDLSDPSYLTDDTIVALIDYLYTDNPEKFQHLSFNEQRRMSASIPFWFMEEAQIQYELIGMLDPAV